MRTIEVLKRVETVKQQCMKQMHMNTSEDIANAASWFTTYVQNFLLKLLLSKQKDRKQLAMKVVQDPTLQQCSQSAQQSEFTRALAAGDIKAAVFCIEKRAFLFRLKRFGSRCKRILHQR